MLTRTQLLGVFVMATLGGLLGGSIGFGIVSGEFTLALICLEVIVALFAIAFVIGSGSGGKPAKKLEDDSQVIELKSKNRYFGVDYPMTVTVHNTRRAGDQHIGGEVLPEFK